MPGVIGRDCAAPAYGGGQNKKLQNAGIYTVDMGLPESRVRQLVHPGTQVALYGPVRALKNGRYASKTVDDPRLRGHHAARGGAFEEHENRPYRRFLSPPRRRKSAGYGAHTVAWALDPDLGIAIDVTHGEMPGCEPGQTHPLGKVGALAGAVYRPEAAPPLDGAVQKVADRLRDKRRAAQYLDGCR